VTLAGSVLCPLCRVDVKEVITAARGVDEPMPLSPRQLGYTRDGGSILRYQPHPPADLPRPSYIPEAMHHMAEFVEIQYPEHGVARIWRVPRDDAQSLEQR